MDIVTKSNRNEYLSTKDRFYLAGWVDGEQDAKSQISWEVCAIDKPSQQYLEGYADAKDNEYATGGNV